VLILNNKQKVAIKLLSDPTIKRAMLYGGARSGKTFACVYAILARAMKAKDSRHGIIRKYLSSLRSSVWDDTLPKVCRLLVPDPDEYKRTFKFVNQFNILRCANGSEICLFGLDDAERADRILGMEFSTLMFEECSELEYSAMNKALTRLAQKTCLVNRAYYTENPPSKRHWTYKLFVDGLKPDGSRVRRPGAYQCMQMNPGDNLDNINPDFMEDLEDMPLRERIRFLQGEFQDDTGKGVVRRDWIHYVDPRDMPELTRIVVSVDPSVSDSDDADEVGIVIVGKDDEDHYYVLMDASFQGSPLQWSAKAAKLYNEFEADFVLYESNQGGLLVEQAIQNVDKSIPCKAVRAYRGKYLRAQSISVLYERGKVAHAREFSELEEEACDWNGENGEPSPNRLDALVYALMELSGGPRRIRPRSKEDVKADGEEVMDLDDTEIAQLEYLHSDNEDLWEAV